MRGNCVLKKALFICNTPYQLLIACNIKHQVLSDYLVDVIISNHFDGSEEIVERINANKVFFNKSYYAPNFDFCRRRGEWASKRNDNRLLYNLDIKKTVETFVFLEDSYDELWIANWEEFANAVFNYIRRYLNHNIVCNIYEDGFVSCLWDWRTVSIELADKSIIRKIYENKFLNIQYTHLNISEYYVTKPELMKFDPGCVVKKIPEMNKYDSSFINDVNIVFNYESCCDIYDKKVIFFEESYHADGTEIGDAELVDSLADIVGMDEIMIKIHPRSKDNRWATRGYKTNTNFSIPWEVIALNQNMSNKILVGIACGSIANSYILFGIGGKSISMLKLCPKADKKDYNTDNPYDVIFKGFKDIFQEVWPNKVLFPKDKKQLVKIVKELVNEG